MDNKTRIEKLALQHVSENGDGSASFDVGLELGYIAGATANYNKGWNDAIDLCIDEFKIWFEGRMTSDNFKKKLASLKTLDETSK